MLNRSENRILYRLKTVGPQSVEALGHYLEISAVGTRQHLSSLLEQELVEYEDIREKVGRPVRYWKISARGHEQFPDTHSALTLDLIDSVRSVFGENGLEKLIKEREKQSLKKYQLALSRLKSVRGKVRELAKLRDEEGYMADWSQDEEGNYLLLENHCPICVAASQCQGLCQSELRLFQQALGEECKVSRVEYLLEGARRCAYQVVKVPEK